MANRPKDYVALHAVFTRWWHGLQGVDRHGREGRDRKSLAELRRINVVPIGGHSVIDVADAVGVDSFQRLIKAVGGLSVADPLEPFIIAATTLARIREDTRTGPADRGATASLLGMPRSEGSTEKLFAEARFKRLMRSIDDWPDLLAQARRVGAILEKKAPVGDLGASIVLWNADPSIRTRWAFNYYQGELEPETADAPKPSSEATSAPSV